jgi:hypothetical protein
VSEIRACHGVLLPADDAEYLVQVIDYVKVKAKAEGVPLSARLVRIRSQMAEEAMAVNSRRREGYSFTAFEGSDSEQEDELMDTKAAAAALGVTPSAVTIYCRDDGLGQKVGREWVIKRSELASFQRDRLEQRGERV